MSSIMPWQAPQSPPAPHVRVTACRDVAPSSIAARTSVSLTAKHAPQQIFGAIVAELTRLLDPFVEERDRDAFDRQIVVQHLDHGLPDVELPELLQIRQPFEEQDALDEPIGVLHLVDRFVA